MSPLILQIPDNLAKLFFVYGDSFLLRLNTQLCKANWGIPLFNEWRLLGVNSAGLGSLSLQGQSWPEPKSVYGSAIDTIFAHISFPDFSVLQES